MQIIKRDNYKMKPDQVVITGLNEEFSKLLCKMLNDSREGDNTKYYYQVVSDEFKVE